jgi:hypothetical protein
MVNNIATTLISEPALTDLGVIFLKNDRQHLGLYKNSVVVPGQRDPNSKIGSIEQLWNIDFIPLLTQPSIQIIETDSINYDEDTTILDLNDTNIFELLTRYLSVNNAQSINFGQSQYLANHDNLSLDANTNSCLAIDIGNNVSQVNQSFHANTSCSVIMKVCQISH